MCIFELTYQAFCNFHPNSVCKQPSCPWPAIGNLFACIYMCVYVYKRTVCEYIEQNVKYN